VLFHHFDGFLAEHDSRFKGEYGYFRPVVKEVTAGHHEARRAVVILQYLAKNLSRMLEEELPPVPAKGWAANAAVV
jgi:hypothetical protein